MPAFIFQVHSFSVSPLNISWCDSSFQPRFFHSFVFQKEDRKKGSIEEGRSFSRVLWSFGHLGQFLVFGLSSVSSLHFSPKMTSSDTPWWPQRSNLSCPADATSWLHWTPTWFCISLANFQICLFFALWCLTNWPPDSENHEERCAAGIILSHGYLNSSKFMRVGPQQTFRWGQTVRKKLRNDNDVFYKKLFNYS